MTLGTGPVYEQIKTLQQEKQNEYALVTSLLEQVHERYGTLNTSPLEKGANPLILKASIQLENWRAAVNMDLYHLRQLLESIEKLKPLQYLDFN